MNKRYHEFLVGNFKRLCHDNYPTTINFCRNLTLMALGGKLAPAYNRERECERISIITHRKTAPNVLLVGKAGCGKTAIVEQYAIENAKRIEDEFINNDFVIESIEDEMSIKTRLHKMLVESAIPIVLELDSSSFVGGTKYRGTFEERLSTIVKELSINPFNVLLFIDEMHLLTSLGASENSDSAAQFLKPALARGEIRVIGATIDDEVSVIAADRALMRRFNVMKIAPLTADKPVIAQKIAADYANYHHLDIAGLDIAEIVSLIDTHFENAMFPNTFINVIDETFAAAAYHKQSNVRLCDITKTISSMIGHLIISST